MVHPVTSGTQTLKINRNMRCIEMIKTVVLPAIAGWINRNMRCIEMQVILDSLTTHDAINRNMRCIEIDVPYPS